MSHNSYYSDLLEHMMNFLIDLHCCSGFQQSRLKAAYLVCPLSEMLSDMVQAGFYTTILSSDCTVFPIQTIGSRRLDRSTGDTYSSLAPDPTSKGLFLKCTRFRRILLLFGLRLWLRFVNFALPHKSL